MADGKQGKRSVQRRVSRVRRKVVRHDHGWTWGFTEVVLECGHSESYRDHLAPTKTAVCRLCSKKAANVGDQR